MSRNIKFTIPVRDDENPDNDSQPLVTDDRFRHTPRSVYGGAAGIRLGLLCVMLVLVIMAMHQAAKPESWNWLFQFGQGDPASSESSDIAAEAPDPATKSNRFNVNGNHSAGGNPTRLDSVSAAELQLQFWKQLLEQMDGQHQVRLFNLIQAVSQQTSLPAGSTAATRPLMNSIHRFRQSFTDRLDDTPSAAADEFRQTWAQSVGPAFESVVADNPDPAKVDERVRELVPVLQQASTELIRDKTPVGRGKEAYAWFAAWSEVFDQPIEQDAGATATVTQLLSQPQAWRGKTLQVTGTALRVERVEASHNALGIERYYVIWIQPDEPSIYPWCVYALMAPEALVGEPDEQIREVEQRVSTTAVFFKNRLFNAAGNRGDEAAYAPVLLTAAVDSPAETTPTRQSVFRLPSLQVILVWLALIGGLATLIAVTVYRSTTGGGVRSLPRSEKLSQEFNQLEKDERVETTIEKLQKLSRQATGEEPAPDASE